VHHPPHIEQESQALTHVAAEPVDGSMKTARANRDAWAARRRAVQGRRL